MVEDGMVAKPEYVKQGDLPERGTVFKRRRMAPKSRTGRSQRVHSSDEAE